MARNEDTKRTHPYSRPTAAFGADHSRLRQYEQTRQSNQHEDASLSLSSFRATQRARQGNIIISSSSSTFTSQKRKIKGKTPKEKTHLVIPFAISPSHPLSLSQQRTKTQIKRQSEGERRGNFTIANADLEKRKEKKKSSP
jgi:hypothetical protein